jgi:predicted site-specific integrase-resolvase
MAPAQRLITLADLCNQLGVSRYTLRRWWLAGKMPMPRKLGHRNVFYENETVPWLATLPVAGPRSRSKKAEG